MTFAARDLAHGGKAALSFVPFGSVATHSRTPRGLELHGVTAAVRGSLRMPPPNDLMKEDSIKCSIESLAAANAKLTA